MLRIIPILLLLLGPAGLKAQTPSPAEATPPVTLLPGDLLQIEVWREEDLSGEFLIDQNGMVVLPMIGEWQVTGVPIAELRDSLVAEYRRELRNPSIIITPLRRVYVLGEVNEPGLLTIDPTVSLGGAIAMAGGTNEIGDLRRIQIVRDGEIVRDGVSPTNVIATLEVLSGDQIIVGRRSWLDRNSTFLVSAMLSVTSIVITLLK